MTCISFFVVECPRSAAFLQPCSRVFGYVLFYFIYNLFIYLICTYASYRWLVLLFDGHADRGFSRLRVCSALFGTSGSPLSPLFEEWRSPFDESPGGAFGVEMSLLRGETSPKQERECCGLARSVTWCASRVYAYTCVMCARIALFTCVRMCVRVGV